MALGDVTGRPEIVVGQLGGGSKVRIFDLTGKLLSEFTAYEPTFAGGVYLSIGTRTGTARRRSLPVRVRAAALGSGRSTWWPTEH